MFNYRAFDTKFPFRKCLSVQFAAHKAAMSPAQYTLSMVVVTIMAAIFSGIIIVSIIGALSEGGQALLVGLSLAAMLSVISGIVVYSVAAQGKHRLIMEQFSSDNGLNYLPGVDTANEQGALFNKGHSRSGRNCISGIIGGNGFVLFQYIYVTGSGKNSQTHYFKVAKIGLAKTFPHIFLDNKKESSLGGIEYDRSQRLTLEGDFNKYFDVYGPKEYEIEVLQILNPSVMQALLDIQEPVDIEILGNQLYIYDKGHKVTKERLQTLFSAIEIVIKSTENSQRTFKMASQIGDYKPILKKSIWPAVITIVFVIIWLGVQIIPYFV